MEDKNVLAIKDSIQVLSADGYSSPSYEIAAIVQHTTSGATYAVGYNEELNTLLVFDMDGTLCDDDDAIQDVLTSFYRVSMGAFSNKGALV